MTPAELRNLSKFKRFLVRLYMAAKVYDDLKREGKPEKFKVCWHHSGAMMYLMLMKSRINEKLGVQKQ